MSNPETDPRPAQCCGKCPPIRGGGYDCTCEGNPRCTKALSVDDVTGILGADWTGGLSSVEFVRSQRR